MHILRSLGAAACGFALAFGLTTASDQAAAKMRWKMTSAFPGKLAELGESGVRFAKNVTELSHDTLELKFFEPGALVPALAYLDAVGTGSIDTAWGSAGYSVGKFPALVFFSSMPFGPDPQEYLAWIDYGGGQALWDEIDGKVGAKAMPCAIIGPEASGWFRKPITGLDDLKGMKIRFFGLGAKVIEKFGASTQLLAGGDIYPALELGTIDATEFSQPAIDEGFGFYQVAKNYYFPGWHQPSSINEFVVNKAAWEKLDGYDKLLLKTACGDSLNYVLTESAAKQFGAMKRMQEKGVTLHRWPDDVLKKFEAAWEDVLKAEVAKDPEVKKVYESYSKFRADYAVWREYGYMR